MPTPAPITVSVEVPCSPERAWLAFTAPQSITAWNAASPDWHCPNAVNDLRPGGRFSYRMEARDGSMGFDFEGTFTEVTPHEQLRFNLGPDREVLVEFTPRGDHTEVRQTFTPESTHPLEMQRAGWQSIMDSYARHVADAH
jgi:uncharacterized protein YndB with AHSA1/START domain